MGKEIREQQRPMSDFHEGWGNLRAGTRLEVREIDDAYIILTALYGIHPDSISVTRQGEFLHLSGQLKNDVKGRAQYGRYVRHVPLEKQIKPQEIQFSCADDGRLLVIIPKRLPAFIAANSDDYDMH